MALVFAALALAGCGRRAALPEAGTPAAALYQYRCGQCHAAYNPRTMTAAMWDLQVARMQGKMRNAGLPALNDAQRATILDYLTRNAGTE
ncbi:MAG TPA: hypothetical protein VMV27_10565 [Candidatus Binataceae bacterium]|nr:hypothetical protein [Candidatus Binataceae bacterium]